MDIMDKTQESEVIAAVMDSIKLANDGMSPSAAVAKSAMDRGYGKDITNRMVEAFNVSKTRKHQKEASDEDKAASFPIACPDEVSAIMYPENIKAPDKVAAAEWLPDECGRVEDRFFDKVLPKLAMDVTPASHDGVDANTMFDRTTREMNSLTLSLKIAHDDMANAQYHMLDSSRELAGYFKELYHEPFDVVEKVAVIKYGGRAHKLMDFIAEMAGVQGKVDRASKEFDKTASVHVYDSRVLDLVDSTVHWTDAYASAAREYVKVSEAHTSYKEAYEVHRDALATGQVKQALVSRFLTKTTSSFLGNLAAASLANRPQLEEEARRFQAEVLDPSVEAERRSIDAQVMLHDFMANDEVLSKANPQQVVSAFNEISALTPRASKSPLVMRALLRKAVESTAFDPHEAATILGLESELGKIEELSKVPELPAVPKEDLREDISAIKGLSMLSGAPGQSK